VHSGLRVKAARHHPIWAASPRTRSRFIVDAHLGKLARYLRMLGFDTAYERCFENAEIIDHSLNEKRIILTRSPELLKHNRVTHGYWVRHEAPPGSTAGSFKRTGFVPPGEAIHTLHGLQWRDRRSGKSRHSRPHRPVDSLAIQ